MLFILPVVMYYQELISNGSTSPVILRDYVVAESINSGLDPQIMQNIAKCESKFRQFDSKGKPLMSPTSDVGLMQVNQVHWKRAKEFGLDIFNSAVDNMEMAKIIHKEQGYTAWSCYKKTATSDV